MKTTNIFYGNQFVGSMYCGKTKLDIIKYYVRRWTRNLGIAVIGTGLVVGGFEIGYISAPIPVSAEIAQRIPPVLVRIAKCESGGSHYGQSGQVLINKTQDIGKYQIHVPIWGKKATEMGLNLAVEEDNEKFALWLYENYGSEPWVYSKKCWS